MRFNIEEANRIPMLSEVELVQLAVNVESQPVWPDGRNLPVGSGGSIIPYYLDRVVDHVNHAIDRARLDLGAYISSFTSVIGNDHVYVGTELEESEFGTESLVFAGSVSVDVSPAEWLKISDAFCMELDYIPDPNNEGMHYRTEDFSLIPALPEEITPTLGILSWKDGLIPAVAIEGTEEGWGSGGHEPCLFASFYVALALRQ